MNEFILRTGREAVHPYLLEQDSINVYTMEEFCWYLQEHLFLVNRELIGRTFISWLREELDEKRLAAELAKILEEGNDLSRCVILIFESSHLYSNKELSLLRKQVLTLAAMSPEERQKIRADYLLGRKRYKEALYLYLDLTTERKSRVFHASERAQIYSSMGVIYARNLLMEEAAEAFRSAYSLAPDEKEKRGYFTALELMEPSERERFTESLAPEGRFQPDDGLSDEIRKQLDQLKGGIAHHRRQTEAIHALQKDENPAALLYEWLTEYEKSME